LALHLLADDPHDLRADADVALHVRTAEVEPAVALAQRLVDVVLVELERELRARVQDLQLVDEQLDLARLHPRVDGLARAADDLPCRLQHEFVADAVRELGCRGSVLGVDDELRDACLVAQVDEDEAAVVAARVDPAGERPGPALVLGARLAAAQRPPVTPRPSVAGSSSRPTRLSSAPRSRIVAAFAPTKTVARAPSRPACVSCPLRERPA